MDIKTAVPFESLVKSGAFALPVQIINEYLVGYYDYVGDKPQGITYGVLHNQHSCLVAATNHSSTVYVACYAPSATFDNIFAMWATDADLAGLVDKDDPHCDAVAASYMRDGFWVLIFNKKNVEFAVELN